MKYCRGVASRKGQGRQATVKREAQDFNFNVVSATVAYSDEHVWWKYSHPAARCRRDWQFMFLARLTQRRVPGSRIALVDPELCLICSFEV